MCFLPQQANEPTREQIIDLPNTASGENVKNEATACHNETVEVPAPTSLQAVEDQMHTNAEPTEEENSAEEEPFVEVDVKRSSTGRTIYSRKLCHEENQGACTDHSNYYEISEYEIEDEDEDETYEKDSESVNVGAGIGGEY